MRLITFDLLVDLAADALTDNLACTVTDLRACTVRDLTEDVLVGFLTDLLLKIIVCMYLFMRWSTDKIQLYDRLLRKYRQKI